VAEWVTDDRITWRSTDGAWLAQLQQSRTGRHLSLAIWEHAVYRGRYDERGWHGPTARTRHLKPRPRVRSLPLPLAS
jgi:hypothetical protein